MEQQHATPPDPVERLARLALAGLACAATTALGFGLKTWLDAPNLVMLFLLNVVIVARWLGQGPAILSAFLGVAAFDFFFVPPHLSFQVVDLQYLLTFAVMFFVALLIGHLTTGLRQNALDADARALQSAALYRLSRRLGMTTALDQLAAELDEIAPVVPGIHCRVYLLDDHDHLRAAGAAAPLDGLEDMAARSALQAGSPRLNLHLTPNDSPLMLVPLRGSSRVHGVLMATADDGSKYPLQRQQAGLESIAVVLAATLERLVSVAHSHQAQLAVAGERFRNSILAAISHDLRTPLATLYGSADALLLDVDEMPATHRERVAAIHVQALHLNTMVGNLLELARLHGGDVQLRKEWQPLEEVVGTSLKLLGSALAAHPVTLDLPPGLPLLEFDAVLIERVLCNLLDNATRHAPAGSPIGIAARAEGGVVRLCVRNGNSRIPAPALAAFDVNVIPEPPGAARRGLGLSICRSILQAHGGRLTAVNEAEGVCVCLCLPLGEPPTMPPDPEDEPGKDTTP